MIRLTRPSTGATVTATFSLPVDEAPSGRCAVVGEFNDWQPDVTVLRRRGKRMSASVQLEPGRRYEFRYRDQAGGWFDDPDAESWADNGFGGVNAVIDLTDRTG